MGPTKRTQAVKKPRKRAVKKAYDGKSPMGKLMKLKCRINFNTINTGRDTDNSDKTWVMEEITNLRGGGWLTAVKMKVANEMWSKYAG